MIVLSYLSHWFISTKGHRIELRLILVYLQKFTLPYFFYMANGQAQ